MKVNKALGFAVALAFSATLMCASAYAATYSAGAVTADAGSTVTVPVVVTPDAGEAEELVNGYVMTLTYDPTEAKPVAIADAVDSVYATAGADFTDGILVSDVISTSQNQETLVVAWAAAQPVTVTQAANLATVDFAVDSSASTDIPVTVAVTQLSNDGTIAEDGTYTVASGSIDLADATVVEWGNVDGSHDDEGNPTITTYDASLAAQYAVGAITLTESQIKVANVDGSIDAEGNATITTYDASLIAQYAVGSINIFPVEATE